MKSDPLSTAVVIPAFNAAESLQLLIPRLMAYVPKENIVVIDDGSTDSTPSVISAFQILCLHHSFNRGKGAALRTGFEFVRRIPFFRHVLTMDADLQHAPEDIPRLFERQQVTSAAIVIGRRERLGAGMPVSRILSNAITSFLVSARTGQTIDDSQCGFRLLDRRVIESVRLTNDGYEAETELLIKGSQNGFGICSADIHTIYAGEKSHMTHWHTTLRFLQVLLRST